MRHLQLGKNSRILDLQYLLGGAGRATRIINTSGTNTVASPVTLADNTSVETMNGNELRLTGGVSGAANLAVNTHVITNAGQVNLKVASGYTGKITTGSGRVVMDDLSFVLKEPAQPVCL